MDPFGDATPDEVPSDQNSGFEDEAVVVNTNESVEEDVEPVTVSPGQDVTSAILGGGINGVTMDNLSLKSTSPITIPREEPETIKAWRREQETMLEEKDKKEEELKQELREKAQRDLKDWYKKYEEQLEKTKGDNRLSEKTFVAEMNEIAPGTEWERVGKLCDFNMKNSRNSKDMSRMKSILLQLKQAPKPITTN